MQRVQKCYTERDFVGKNRRVTSCLPSPEGRNSAKNWTGTIDCHMPGASTFLPFFFFPSVNVFYSSSLVFNNISKAEHKPNAL